VTGDKAHRPAAGFALAVGLAACAAAQTESPYRVEWRALQTPRAAVVLTADSAEGVARIHRELAAERRPASLLAVRVRLPGVSSDTLPPMSGAWSRAPEGLKFTPEFPLTPGLTYEATFRVPGTTNRIRVTRTLPKPRLAPRATVRAVYPSASVLPENLLKFYLHFSHPMSRGDVYRHITLLDEREQPVALPFLELGEELWDPEQMRLTLLIDPGRIKRGVKPLEDLGPAIRAGRRYTLHISRQWRDSRGVPMKADFRKSFRVGPPDRTPVNPLEWHLTRPDAGTRQPLRIRFSEPLDHALARRVIWIEDPDGKAVKGRVTLSDEETVWQLHPDAPWRAGRHQLRAALILEDLAGNSIGRPFEVDVFNRVDDGIQELPFGRSFLIEKAASANRSED